jgi:hypothetical protein
MAPADCGNVRAQNSYLVEMQRSKKEHSHSINNVTLTWTSPVSKEEEDKHQPCTHSQGPNG